MFSVLIGLVLGTAVGVLNFRLLLLIYRRIGQMTSRNGGMLAVGGYLLHAVVYVGLVALAVYVKQISIAGTVVGLVASSGINLYLSRKNVQSPVQAGEHEAVNLQK